MEFPSYGRYTNVVHNYFNEAVLTAHKFDCGESDITLNVPKGRKQIVPCGTCLWVEEQFGSDNMFEVTIETPFLQFDEEMLDQCEEEIPSIATMRINPISEEIEATSLSWQFFPSYPSLYNSSVFTPDVKDEKQGCIECEESVDISPENSLHLEDCSCLSEDSGSYTTIPNLRAFTPNGETRYAEGTPVGPRLQCTICTAYDHQGIEGFDPQDDSPVCHYEDYIQPRSSLLPLDNPFYLQTAVEPSEEFIQELAQGFSTYLNERLFRQAGINYVANPLDQSGRVPPPTGHLRRNRWDLINNAYTLSIEPILNDFQIAEVIALFDDFDLTVAHAMAMAPFVNYGEIYVLRHKTYCPLLEFGARARWTDMGRETRDCPKCMFLPQNLRLTTSDRGYYNFNRSHRINPQDQAGRLPEQKDHEEYETDEDTEIDTDESTTDSDEEILIKRQRLADMIKSVDEDQRRRIEYEAQQARMAITREMRKHKAQEKEVLDTLFAEAISTVEERKEVENMLEDFHSDSLFFDGVKQFVGGYINSVYTTIPFSFLNDCAGWFGNAKEAFTLACSSYFLWWLDYHWIINVISGVFYCTSISNFSINVIIYIYMKITKKREELNQWKPSNIYERVRAGYRAYNLIEKIKSIYNNEFYRKIITIIAAAISVFAILWVLRKKMNTKETSETKEETKDDKEDKTEYANQGWLSDSAKHITQNNRIAQCLVGLFSLLMFTDFSFWKKSKDTIEFVKNLALLKSGSDVRCSSTTCLQKLPVGKDLCGACRSGAITSIINKEVLVLNSPDHIQANPAPYGRRLVKDIVFNEPIDWYFALPTNVQYAISRVYNCTPLDIREKNYTVYNPDNSDFAWFQPPLTAVYPNHKNASQIIDVRNISNFTVHKVHFAQTSAQKFQELELSDSEVHEYRRYKEIWHNNFFDFEHGPWYRTVSSERFKHKLFYFPIKKEETQFTLFRKFKNYIDKIPVIGKYFDEIVGITIVASICLVVYLKIETVKQAVDGLWGTIFPGVEHKVQEHIQDETEKTIETDEGGGFQNKRQKGYDDKQNKEEKSNSQTGSRYEQKQFKEREDKTRVREERARKDVPFLFYDDPLKIVNSRLGYAMTKARSKMVYAHSMAERKMYFDQGYRPAVTNFGRENIRGEIHLIESERISQVGQLARTVNAFLAGSPAMLESFMPGTVLADIREEMAENRQRQPEHYRMPPLMEETAAILNSPKDSPLREELVRQFCNKYSVPIPKKNESFDFSGIPQVSSWSKKVCEMFDKKMCCMRQAVLGKKCFSEHPDAQVNEEGFIYKPDAREVACPTNCKTKGCPFKHSHSKINESKDEALLNHVPPAVVDSRCNFLLEKKIGPTGDLWIAVGQIFFNGINFLSVQHIDKQNPVPMSSMRMVDSNRAHAWNLREIINVNTHTCTDDCEANCTMNDHCIVVPHMPTEDLKQIKSYVSYRLNTMKTTKLNDPIRLIRLDLKTALPQQATGKIVAIKEECILFDCPTEHGYSGSVIVNDRTGHAIAIHKSAYDSKSNRALTYSLSALSAANNPVGSAKSPKKVNSSKDSQSSE